MQSRIIVGAPQNAAGLAQDNQCNAGTLTMEERAGIASAWWEHCQEAPRRAQEFRRRQRLPGNIAADEHEVDARRVLCARTRRLAMPAALVGSAEGHLAHGTARGGTTGDGRSRLASANENPFNVLIMFWGSCLAFATRPVNTLQ